MPPAAIPSSVRVTTRAATGCVVLCFERRQRQTDVAPAWCFCASVLSCQLEDKVGAHNYHPLPVVLSRRLFLDQQEMIALLLDERERREG